MAEMSSYGSAYTAYSDSQHISNDERNRVEIIAGQAYNMLCRQDSKVSRARLVFNHVPYLELSSSFCEVGPE